MMTSQWPSFRQSQSETLISIQIYPAQCRRTHTDPSKYNTTDKYTSTEFNKYEIDFS